MWSGHSACERVLRHGALLVMWGNSCIVQSHGVKAAGTLARLQQQQLLGAIKH